MASKKALTGKHQYNELQNATVVERIRKMVELRDSLNVDDLHVKLSYGNRKTTALVPSVSLIPVADCGNCSLCKNGCYDVRHVCCFKESQAQRANNSAIYHKDPGKYFSEIEKATTFLRFFRWHVGADIIDFSYLLEVVGIAVRNQKCEYLIFTKMYGIVNEFIGYAGGLDALPKNLHIIFSDWPGAEFENPYNLPISSPVWPDGKKGSHCTDREFLCVGDCSACAEVNSGCWSAKPGDTILFEAH